jgi:hypothetical protein
MVRFKDYSQMKFRLKRLLFSRILLESEKSMVIKWLITMLFTKLFVLINDFALQRRTRYLMAPFGFIRKLMNYKPSKLR